MLIAIKGAGDLASGIALRLYRARFNVAMSELALPTTIRTAVSFSRAVTEGVANVEGVNAKLARNAAEAAALIKQGLIAVLVDPDAASLLKLKPDVLVDAILAKANLGTRLSDAPVVIGVGPGFSAGVDCHAVVETRRGHTLGRVITEGCALKNTGEPGEIGGYTIERLLKAPAAGVFTKAASIGEVLEAGEAAGYVGEIPMRAKIRGVLRGILPSGIPVYEGMKCGDIDPRPYTEHCFTVSDKALAIGGGVLEAILRFTPENRLDLR